MKKKRKIISVFVSALIITALFHKQALGINLLVFELAIFAYFVFFEQFRFSGKNQIICGAGLLITAIFTVLTHSTFSYVINFLVLFIFIGILIYPELKSLINSASISFMNLFNSQVSFIKELSSSKFGNKNLGSFLWKFRIFVLPLIIILFFVIIYRNSNPVFDSIIDRFGGKIYRAFQLLSSNFDFWLIFTFFIGLVLSNFLLLRTPNTGIQNSDSKASDFLQRLRNNPIGNFKFNALRNEVKSAIFLFIILNLLLLLLNIIDVYWVWFNFEWEGQYLKQFVHQGTYLLILSILISIALVLYFFRGNVNFYRKNTFLKQLSYIWLAQNAVLCISVAIRNFWYINYFSLAYKRIGVIIFLILTIYGLYTVFVKVRRKKTRHFLVRKNAYAILFVLIFSSIINWDGLIAKYNFVNAHKSFLHLDYMSSLSDKSLPYLNKTLPELTLIDMIQKEKFPFEQKYMSPEIYYDIIKFRKLQFKEKWEQKNFLSWNLPEYLAYKELFGGENDFYVKNSK